jgi:hypothetical protein
MTNSRKISFIVWLLIVSFADIAAAMTVYMNDESEIEAQSAWKDGERVYVRTDTDLSLDFPASEVNVRKSGIPNDPQERPAKVDKGAKTPTLSRSGSIMDELIEVAGHRRDFNDMFGRSGRSEIDQLFADSFTPALAEKSFKRSLAQRLDNRDLDVVLAWYKSPVGRKVVEADSVWDFNRQEKAASYAGRDSVPGFKERMSLIGQIVKITGAAEMETRMTQNIMHKMIDAIPPDYEDAKEIKKRIQDEIPTLEMNRGKNIQNWAYTYRDLSTHELRDYLKFLRSATGKKYLAAVSVATAEIFKKVAMNVEKDFRKSLRR